MFVLKNGEPREWSFIFPDPLIERLLEMTLVSGECWFHAMADLAVRVHWDVRRLGQDLFG